MSYLVRAWWMPKGKMSHERFWEFETEEEARDFANWKADQLSNGGYEFDVSIFQRIE